MPMSCSDALISLPAPLHLELDNMRKAYLLLFSLAIAPLLSGCLSEPVYSPETANQIPTPFAARLHYPEAWSLFYYGQARLLASESRFDEAVEALEHALEFDPHSAYLKLSLGRLLLQQDDDEGAIRMIEDALIEDPNLLDAYLLLGGLYFNQRNFSEAARQLTEAVRVAPEKDAAWLHLGLAHMRAGNSEQAIEVFQTFLERDPESGTAMVHLARAYQSIDLLSRAEDIFRELIRIHPDQMGGYLELGEMLEEQGDVPAAEAVYLAGLNQVDQPGPLYHRLSRVLVKQGRLDEARQFLEKQQSRNPNDLEAMRKVGLIQLEQENWSEAALIFQRILDDRPDLDQIRYYLGTAIERQEDWLRARETFEKIPEDSELYPDALYHRSYLNHQLGEVDMAINQLRELIESGYARVEFYDFLASLYEEQNDSEKALETLMEGSKKYPGETSLLYHRGVTYERLGNRAAAMDVMKAVLKLDPDHPEALNYLAYGYAETGGDLDLALQLVEKALEYKHAPHIVDTLGWVHYRLGNFDQAREALERASGELPEDAVIWEHLGDLYRDMGLKDEAGLAYGEALRLAPETPGLLDKLQLVSP